MRHYIAECRKVRPIVPPDMSEYIVSSYVQMRKQQKEDEAEDKNYSYVSARTLLAVLRLSQALARLRMDSVVGQGDVDEALRLMETSKASLYEHQARDREGGDGTDTSKIFRIVKDMASSSGKAAAKEQARSKKTGNAGRAKKTRKVGRRARGRGPSSDDEEEEEDEGEEEQEDEEEEELEELSMVEVRSRVLAKGFTETQLMDTILEVSLSFVRVRIELIYSTKIWAY